MRIYDNEVPQKNKSPGEAGAWRSSYCLGVHAVLLPDFLGDFALRLAEGQDPVERTENHCEGAQCQNYISHAVSLRVWWLVCRTHSTQFFAAMQ